jgi:hypothetical protein
MLEQINQAATAIKKTLINSSDNVPQPMEDGLLQQTCLFPCPQSVKCETVKADVPLFIASTHER